MEKPLQARDELLSERIQQNIIREAMQLGDAGDYVDMLATTYRHLPIYDTLVGLAYFIERTPQEDGSRPESTAFIRGGLIALAAADHAGGSKLLDEMPHLEVLVPTKLDWNTAQGLTEKVDIVELMGATIVQTAVSEYDQCEPFHRILEAWEDCVIPDVRYQSFYRGGFGLMAYFARRTMEKFDTEPMAAVAAQLDAGEELDWDAMPWGSAG